MELSEISLITIISLLISFILYFVRIIMKSKCYEFSCMWGLFSVKRDVKIEEDLEKLKIERNIVSNNDLENMNNNINNIISTNKNNNVIK